ncbi:ABC transporter substrate-binding protein [Massilia agilis]|uniref:ABC transporter substrate-binding protein n=1 Tax=Massilia agilis TaxID=1811226 RepID=A0ABT2DC24_9BURK|nr:ABC transporter substrate-binding protein [Massilia agilis]MCS0808712.1 ABC transporter substrate-binding protein [Massilia agilis]
MKPYVWIPVALVVAAPHVQAQQNESRPDRMVRATIDGVMAAIDNDPVAAKGDADRIYQIVQQKFLPNTDFMLTTQYAVGKEAWAKATQAQRDALFKQFQTLLARTYATQLMQIRGQQTQFKYPPMAALPSSATDAVVRTQVVSGGDTMPIDYRVHKTDAGWKIYDINMMGAWMIVVYRQQFGGQLAKGGIDGLIKYLAAHNEANA